MGRRRGSREESNDVKGTGAGDAEAATVNCAPSPSLILSPLSLVRDTVLRSLLAVVLSSSVTRIIVLYIMSSQIQALEPKIRQILSAPGTDLSTISAKRVRKQLLELDPSLSSDFVKEKKDEIDDVIAKVYEHVSAVYNGAGGVGDDDDDDTSLKRKRGDASDDEPAAAPPKKTKKTKTKQEKKDEELARQLQNEINGRGRSSRAGASTSKKATGAKRGKKAKSSNAVGSDGEAVESEGEGKKKRGGGGFKKEYMLRCVYTLSMPVRESLLCWRTTAQGSFTYSAISGEHILTIHHGSEPLATLLGVEKLSRPQIVKQLWDHIKANNLQNPENKKEIVCDDQFRAVFKVDRIDMFKMNKELGQYVSRPVCTMARLRLTRLADTCTRHRWRRNLSCFGRTEDLGGAGWLNECPLLRLSPVPTLVLAVSSSDRTPAHISRTIIRHSPHWHHIGISAMHPMGTGSMGCYQHRHQDRAIGRSVCDPYCPYNPLRNACTCTLRGLLTVYTTPLISYPGLTTILVCLSTARTSHTRR